MNSLARCLAKCFEAEPRQGVDLALLGDVQHPADAKAIERASPVGAPRHLAHASGIAATLRQRCIEAIGVFLGVRLQIERDIVANSEFLTH